MMGTKLLSLILRRVGLFGVKIDFREAPLISENESVGGILVIYREGFGRLISNRDLVMLLRASERNLRRHLQTSFSSEFRHLTISNVVNQHTFLVKTLQARQANAADSVKPKTP